MAPPKKPDDKPTGSMPGEMKNNPGQDVTPDGHGAPKSDEKHAGPTLSTDAARGPHNTTGEAPPLAAGADAGLAADAKRHPPGSAGELGPITPDAPPKPAKFNPKGGPADDVSVRDLFGHVTSFLGSVFTGQWGETIRSGGVILTVFADLFDSPVFPVSGRLLSDDDGPDLDRLNAECQRAKEHVQQFVAQGKPVRWAGEPHPTSGTAPGLAADPKGIDPGTVLLVIQLVQQLVAWFRSRRNPV